MYNGNIAQGKNSKWQLHLPSLGKGYSGEVFSVISLDDHRLGVLKKPDPGNKLNTTDKQARQIEREGEILDILSNAPVEHDRLTVRVCRVLDRSLKTSATPLDFFIVTEKARGIEFPELADVYKTQGVRFPRLVLLKILYGVLLILDQAHKNHILWNDVKPEHLFWDALDNCLTIIDWANGEYVESNGITRDLNFSIEGDFFQFVERMTKSVRDNDPELFSELMWPPDPDNWKKTSEFTSALRERILEGLHQESQKAQAIINRENKILELELFSPEVLKQLSDVHEQLVFLGETPNYAGLLHFIQEFAHSLIETKDHVRLDELINYASKIPDFEPDQWELVRRLHLTIISERAATSDELSKYILHAGINAEWDKALWGLRKIAGEDKDPVWWEALSADIRKRTKADESPRPVKAAQALVDALKDQHDIAKNSRLGGNAISQILTKLDDTINELRGYISTWGWSHPQKGAGVSYPFIKILEELEKDYSRPGEPVHSALHFLIDCVNQPRAFMKNLLEDWNEKDFERAKAQLPLLFMWDPDLKRLIYTEIALTEVVGWLMRLETGPKGEHVDKLLSDLKAQGEEFRDSVGEANWLSTLISGIDKIVNGEDIKDVINQTPDLVTYMPWLRSYQISDVLPVEFVEKPKFKFPEVQTEVQPKYLNEIIKQEKSNLAEKPKTKTPSPPQEPPVIKFPDQEREVDKKILRLFYSYLKAGELKLAEKALDQGTKTDVYQTYRSALYTIMFEMEMGSNLIQPFLINSLPTDDKERNNLARVINLVSDWKKSIKDYGLSIGIRTVQSASNGIVQNWDLVKAIVEESNICSEAYNKYAWTLSNIVKGESWSFPPKNIYSAVEKTVQSLEKLKSDFSTWSRTYESRNENSIRWDEAIRRVLRKAKDIEELKAAIAENTQFYRGLLDSFSYFENNRSYKERDWKNANVFMHALEQLSISRISAYENRRKWTAQFRKIQSSTTLAEIEEDINVLDNNHPLYSWLVGFYSRKKAIHTWLAASITTILVVPLLVASFMLYQLNHVNCERDPDKCNPTATVTITMSPLPKPTETFSSTPTPEFLITSTAIATLGVPTPISTIIASPLPGAPNIFQLPLPGDVTKWIGTDCLIYHEYYSQRRWEDYHTAIDQMDEDQYEDVAKDCNWSYSQQQKKVDIRLYQAWDAYFQRDEKSAVSILVNEDLPAPENNNLTVFSYLQTVRTVNASCNMDHSSLLEIQSASLYLEYIDWVLSKIGNQSLVYEQVCHRNYQSFRASVIDAATNISKIQTTIYVENAVLANPIPENCPYIALESVRIYRFSDQFRNCFVPNSNTFDITKEFQLDPNQIDFEVNYCYPENLQQNGRSFGVVFFQPAITSDYAFVLGSGKVPTAYLFGNGLHTEFDESDRQVHSEELIFQQSLLRGCWMVNLRITRAGNLIFLGDGQNLAGLLPVVLPDEYRSIPIELGLWIPSVETRHANIIIDTIQSNYVGAQP